MRKVIAAGGSQKNWRLNGETVHALQDGPAPDRYDNLQSGDIAVFGFDGVGVPDGITLVLLSGIDPVDAAPHAALSKLIDDQRMIPLSDSQLRDVVAACSPAHPLRELLDPELDVALEEAALGSATALAKLRTRSIHRTTHKALANARLNAERIGRDGEALVNGYLRGELSAGRIAGYVWEAESNATHPHDFSVETIGGVNSPIEVKSTNGIHTRALMFSHAEIEFAAKSEMIEVWRLSELRDGRAILRKSKGLHKLASRLVSAAAGIEPGVMPNGWTISTAALEPWAEPFEISVDDDPEE
jgi:hypothetical protein